MGKRTWIDIVGEVTGSSPVVGIRRTIMKICIDFDKHRDNIIAWIAISVITVMVVGVGVIVIKVFS